MAACQPRRRPPTTPCSTSATPAGWSVSVRSSSTGPRPGAEGHVARDPRAWASADARFDRADRGAVAHEGWTTIDGRADRALGSQAPASSSSSSGWQPAARSASFPSRVAELVVDPADQAGRLTRRRAPISRPSSTSSATPGPAHSPRPPGLPLPTSTRPARRSPGPAATPSGTTWPTRRSAGSATTPSRFAEREQRRGRRYAGVILDPPSYGHGGLRPRPGSSPADLPALLATCVALLADGPAFILLSAHTPGFGPDRLGEALLEALEPELGPGGGGRRSKSTTSRSCPTRASASTWARWPAGPDDSGRRSAARPMPGSRRPDACASGASGDDRAEPCRRRPRGRSSARRGRRARRAVRRASISATSADALAALAAAQADGAPITTVSPGVLDPAGLTATAPTAWSP